jgi:hypothetical protein
MQFAEQQLCISSTNNQQTTIFVSPAKAPSMLFNLLLPGQCHIKKPAQLPRHKRILQINLGRRVSFPCNPYKKASKAILTDSAAIRPMQGTEQIG